MKVDPSLFQHGMQFTTVVILPTLMTIIHANVVVNSSWDIKTDQIVVKKLQHLMNKENGHTLKKILMENNGLNVYTILIHLNKRRKEYSDQIGKISLREITSLPCNAGASVNLGKFHLSALNMVATAFVTVLFTK